MSAGIYISFTVPKIRYMTPITDHITSDSDILDVQDADQFSILLRLKELSFLLIILFFGCSGFSLCIQKIYTPNSIQKIDNIIIHDIDLAQVESNQNVY